MTELIDGTAVVLRQLEPDDGPAVLALYENLTGDEWYFRFFTRRPAHLEAWARSLVEPRDGQGAIGAFESGTLVGVANYVASMTPGVAEVAIVVAHNEHLRGIGTALLQRLGEMALCDGIQHFAADVLSANHPMLRVVNDAGWPSTTHRHGSVLKLHVDLTRADASQ